MLITGLSKGCSSDVPVHYYSLSTDLNPWWNGTHATQPEFHAYLKSLVVKHRLHDRISFYSKLVSAEWDGEEQMYRLVIEDVRTGTTKTTSANVVISAIGGFDRPIYPDIQGISKFKGISFHSARWNHDVDLSGKKIAVIGNGCSAYVTFASFKFYGILK